METTIASWTGESILIRRDPPTGCFIIIAIHSSKLGPATGGTRMMRYDTLEDAIRDAQKLAEGMTCKYALADFPRGGGKAVIAVTMDLTGDERVGLLHRYGSWIRQLGGYFSTGPDVGTSSEDMDVIWTTGSPFVFSRTQANGGAGGSGEATGYGTYCAMKAAASFLFGSRSLEGRRILVQGVGSVGRSLIEHIRREGARILISDIDERVSAAYPDLEFVAPADVYTISCDIFSPCALGGILNQDTIPAMRCKAVVGAANNQLGTEADAGLLKGKGILYAPDFACNVGGALAITGMEALGWTRQQAFDNIDRVEHTLLHIFQEAERTHVSTHAAALSLVNQKLNGKNQTTPSWNK